MGFKVVGSCSTIRAVASDFGNPPFEGFGVLGWGGGCRNRRAWEVLAIFGVEGLGYLAWGDVMW